MPEPIMTGTNLHRFQTWRFFYASYRYFFNVAWLFLAMIVGIDDASGQVDAKPNILFILTDDQGWPTLGCYGNKLVPTPHLDQLASQGVRFTDAYVMPQCTPTRAALLSGQHTARNGMWHVIPWYGSPWARIAEPSFREQFPRDLPSLPKALRAGGYQTGVAGKWHLTNNADGDYASLRPEAGLAYGFDFVASRGPGSQNAGDKWVDHLTDAAISFIRERQGKPWFFYLAHHTLHGQLSAPELLVNKYRQNGAPAEGMHNATYLAAIEHLDHSIGRLMSALDEVNQRENTLVVFLSDNGGVDTSYALPHWTDEAADGSVPLKIRLQEFDNAPLRGTKGSAYEGGIRVPCIVHWPAQAKAGHVCETPIHVVDWLPTLLAAAGVSPAADHTLDGVSLLPLLRGESISSRPLYWYLPLYELRWAMTPCAVIRDGDWKLIEFFGDWFDNELRYQVGGRRELYNLREDLGENRNLADMEHDRVTRMSHKLHLWMNSVSVPIPSQNPHFQAKRNLEETREKQPWNR